MDGLDIVISAHSCIGVELMKIFGIEMEPLQNSAVYEDLVRAENVLEKPAASIKMSHVVLQQDMYKYKINNHDHGRFYLQFYLAPKRIGLSLPGEFELVKIKSNGVNLIRIFIAEDQVQIHFHPLYHSQNRSSIIEGSNCYENYRLSDFESWKIRLNRWLRLTRFVVTRCGKGNCNECIYEYEINSFAIQNLVLEYFDDFKLTNYAVGNFEGLS